MNEFKYAGTELDLFAAMHNWKSYWSGRIRPFIGGDVLEVGAGIGANTPYLDRTGSGRWVCLEPDPELAAQLGRNVGRAAGRSRHETACGTTKSLDPGSEFDTILYIDVLEHIENDREELETAASMLRSGGRLLVLSPAHQCLFTPFDKAIGHFRRYNRRMLRDISPAGLRLEQTWYLDSVGILLSAANLLILRQSMPTRGQLAFWDRCVIPLSRLLDRCFFGGVGKSIVAIWQREEV